MESDLVIKVKYGDTLRRFSMFVNGNGSLDLNLDGLRAKILNLFNFTPDADLTLTYVDEDNDVVTLVDDNDLHDAIRQRLNPLRINVRLNTNGSVRFDTRSTGSSTPMRSPRIQSHPLSHMNSGVVEVMKYVPEPFLDVLLKLPRDLASKAASSSPVLTELVESLSKLGLPPVGSIHQFQNGTTSSAQCNDLDCSVDSKVTESPSASKGSVGTPEMMSNVQFVNPAPAIKPKEYDSGNMIIGGGTSLPPTTACMDLNVDLPKDSNESGCSNVDISVTSVLASNGLPKGNEKHHQKERDGHLSVKPISAGPLSSAPPADHMMHVNQNPSQSSEAVVPLVSQSYTCIGSAVLDGDNIKQLPSGIGISSVSPVGFNFQNRCPINWQIQAGASDVPPGGYHCANPVKRSYNHCDSLGRMFHKGVRCDGCGVHPITGPRFKSKVKEDYDLCSICFSEMGNEAEYVRLDHPMSYRPRQIFKELHDPLRHPQLQGPLLSHGLQGCGMKPHRPKLDSRFIQDVNVADETVMAPTTPFTKIWRMRNNGTIAWPRGTLLVWIGGDQFTNRGSIELEIPVDGCPVDKELDIAVDFMAPERPGRFISYWRMALPSGQKFGQRVWVLIQVDASLQGTLSASFHGLNLNLPPESSGPSQIIDVNVEPMDAGHPEPGPSNTTAELVKPMVDEQSRKEEEIDFSLNDGLVGGNGDSVTVPPEGTLLVSYPVVDSSSPSVPSLVGDVPTLSEEANDSNIVEEILLKELEEMGFKQIDLNKEILRLNEYNLELSVDDLCGFSEWDPILEELQEMGFCDKERNKKLLVKNGGSIKRVVLDLITGEKDE